jgi:hypothetical protein
VRAPTPDWRTGLGRWVRDRALGLTFVALFLVSWVGQAVVQWFEYRADQADHGAPATVGGWLLVFGRATLENWQSEFLQLSAFVILSAYLLYRGSPESRDSDDRVEAKLDRVLVELGIDPTTITEGGR